MSMDFLGHLEERVRCRNCGGDAGDNHFDRSLCACGSMHHYCNGCGHALDDCSVSASGGPISDERLRDAVALLKTYLVKKASQYPGVRACEDRLKAFDVMLDALSISRAVLTQQEAALKTARGFVQTGGPLYTQDRLELLEILDEGLAAGVRPDG